jgi:hypothetical protein
MAQSAFGIVIWVVCGCGIVVAIWALVGARKAWEDYGKNRLMLESELGNQHEPGSAAALVERDAEIRELLEARNARRARRGEAPLDVDAELRRLTAPQIDAQLQSEIRELVVARNHRRVRAGKPPLDVEEEVQREIERFGALG